MMLIVTWTTWTSMISMALAVIRPESHKRTCSGTREAASRRGTSDARYQFYRTEYEDCTEVLRNLEIVHLVSNGYDMSFLENIRVVHGYVLIYGNVVDRIPLTNLRVIRGGELYERSNDKKRYSLFVHANIVKNRTVGLSQLRLDSLTDILAGNVYIAYNYRLCPDQLVNWTQILRRPTLNGSLIIENKATNCSSETVCERNCQMPLGSVRGRLCMNTTADDQCQEVVKQCFGYCEGMCVDGNPSQCCHHQCAGGCSGPSDTDCWACRSLTDGNRCVESCPRRIDVDSGRCVTFCPDGRFILGRLCVATCGENRWVENGICRLLDGSLGCNGTDGEMSSEDGYLNSQNIDRFTDCEIIEGSLRISQNTFNGDEFLNMQPLTVAQVRNAMKKIRIIRNYLHVHGKFNGLTSLSVFRNLEEIHGNKLFGRHESALIIEMTDLTSLSLVSLRKIKRGAVAIVKNAHLCLVKSVDWSQIGVDENSQTITDNGENCANVTCSSRCHEPDLCWGPRHDECQVCKNFQRVDSKLCVDSCSDPDEDYDVDDDDEVHAVESITSIERRKRRQSLMFVSDTLYRKCKRCDEQCVGGCHGEGPDECEACRGPRDGPVKCVDQCPSGKFVLFGLCRDLWMLFLFISLILVAIFGMTLPIVLRRRKKALQRQIEEVIGLRDGPIAETGAKPNMSSLRICNESEIRRGDIIGAGAFGTVFKGYFVPERERVKIPVALKELSDVSGPEMKTDALLDEAKVMASVSHPCCVRIVAVCLTRKPILITPLMPYGSLIDYIERNKMNIGSRALMTWSQQIAAGMEYLESVGIVHRDLAARNVLVQSSTQVRITDFGLAKLLDHDEHSFQSTGVKLPIKWLALESIKQLVFNHKTDVWSYGVTLWELFTFGQQPFKGYKNTDMAKRLEQGDRLPQPAICTIDVYMLMVKCWCIDSCERPTFSKLNQEFSRMSSEPTRYLVIKNDASRQLETMEPQLDNLISGINSTSGDDDLDKIISADDYCDIRHNPNQSQNLLPAVGPSKDLELLQPRYVSKKQFGSSYLSLNASTSGLDKPFTASASLACITNSGLGPTSNCVQPIDKVDGIGRNLINSGIRTNSDGYLTPSLDTGPSTGREDYLEVLGGSLDNISGVPPSIVNDHVKKNTKHRHVDMSVTNPIYVNQL